jgi:hypothetical protein
MLLDHERPLVERRDDQAVREDAAGVDLGDLRLQPLEHVPAVLAPEHHHDAADDLALAVLERRALPDRVADAHVGDVAHRDRRPALRREDDGLEVRLRADQADPADDELLGVAVDDVAADVRVVPGDSFGDRSDRQVVLQQLVGIELDLVLLDVAAEGIHLRDAGHALEQRADRPVLRRSHVSDASLARLAAAARFERCW